jgi:hypothetical protein
VNIVDNMVLMLEKYAVNLETIVEQRTAALIEEKQKTDTLLYRMLPTYKRFLLLSLKFLYLSVRNNERQNAIY